MAKQKNTVGDLDESQKKEFNKMLKESTDLYVQMESCKMSIKDISDRAKEELDLPTSEFNKYAKIAFDNSKAKEELDKAEEVYTNCVDLGIIQDDE